VGQDSDGDLVIRHGGSTFVNSREVALANYLLTEESVYLEGAPCDTTGFMANALEGAEAGTGIRTGLTGGKGDLPTAGLAAAGLMIKTSIENGQPAIPVSPQGGVYVLRDSQGNIVKTGRTGDLEQRRNSYRYDKATKDLTFDVVERTDDYAEQRGLEQKLYDAYPNAPMNKIRAIRLDHPLIEHYLKAAEDFMARVGLRIP
jgi:hypothetical protein